MIHISHVDISDDFVDRIISFFQDNILKTYTWDETRVLSMDGGGIGSSNLSETYYDILNLAKEVKSKVTDDKFSVLQNVEIVKYPCGASKTFHKDRTRKTTTGASITYLNDTSLTNSISPTTPNSSNITDLMPFSRRRVSGIFATSIYSGNL